MAPSSGHLLVPKVMKVFKHALSKTASLLRSKVPTSTNTATTTRTAHILEPIPLRVQQPLHPLAILRQSRTRIQSRLFHSSSLNTSKTSPRLLRSSLPTSHISKTLHHRGSTPFASTLRPSFTGTVARNTLGGARTFSSAPTCHAQVLSNVSAAVRAFWLQGHRARYDGCDLYGQKRFARVSVTQDEGLRTMRKVVDISNAKGTIVRFRLAPTVTALAGAEQTLADDNIMHDLASDFARGVQDLAAILSDLTKLKDAYGALPVSWAEGAVSVRFAGCDGKVVEGLCDEVGVRRGVIVGDEGWAVDEEDGSGKGDRDVRMALLFPFAPSSTPSTTSPNKDYVAGMFTTPPTPPVPHPPQSSPGLSTRSLTSALDSPSWSDEGFVPSPPEDSIAPSLWATEPSSSAPRSHPFDGESVLFGSDTDSESVARGRESAARDYEGVEGIYRFLAECEGARR